MTTATIHLRYHGVALDLALADASTTNVEHLIDSLLARDGWQAVPTMPAQSTPSAARKPAASKVAPSYGADGEPCCPVHRKPLAEGRYGWYCSAKARPGDQANDKGYCALKFEE